MRSKGFTLIELLAVIVILAIIALIAVPIVLNIINNSKEQSVKISAEHYLDAVNNAVAREYLKDSTVNLDGTYSIEDQGKKIVEQTNGKQITVEYDGEVVESGAIVIENGKITSATKLKINNYFAKLESGKITVTKTEGGTVIPEEPEIPKEPISKTESYVGCYADVDADGTVDGIIYADLSEGAENKGNGKWGYNGEYTITKTTNLNDYYIIGEDNKDGFGEKPVIAPIGTDKTKVRFYVMSLSDFTTTTPEYTTFYWYYNASGNMSDYINTTGTAFGTGKNNTEIMLSKVYGEGLKDGDIWKYIGDKFSKGWYIPSKDEWAAFGGELGITSVNYYSEYRLMYTYWSSSQNSTDRAWVARFYTGDIAHENVSSGYYIRLSTTF